MEDIDVFHFDDNRKKFDDCCHVDVVQMWYARELMVFLGYTSYNSFLSVIKRAIAACVSAEIDTVGNFNPIEREIDGKKEKDYNLSKFACYLIAMNGDPKKEEVARAQIYFVAAAETLKHYLQEQEDIERILIREEVTEHEKSLSGIANSYGISAYQLFQNAGYRGMYNMNMNPLKEYKGLTNLRRSLLDYMGKEELAANLFRLTQTEAKMKNDGVRGQSRLEALAEQVGRQVRKAMMEISGTRPEDLPLAPDLRTVKKQLKTTHKKLVVIGSSSKQALLKPPKASRKRKPPTSG